MGRSKRQNLARSRNAARDVTAEETRPPCSDEVQAYRNLLFKKSMCLHPANAPVIRSCGVVEIPGKGRGLVARRHFCEGEKIFEVQCWVRGESSGEILSNVLRRRWAEGGAKARYFNEMVLGMWCWRAKETRTPQQIWDDAQIESEAARLAPDLEIETIRALHDRIRTNAHDVGLFVEVALGNHSCCPNMKKSLSSDKRTMRLIATQRIAPGEELTYSYLSKQQLHLETEERQRALCGGWGFRCTCERCSAPVDTT